jgi:hypothetical protein
LNTSSSIHIKMIAIAIFLLLVMTSSLTFAACKSEADWFPHAQTPEPDNANFASSSNCEFHQWSWQTFLWLTAEVDGKPRFLTFNSPYSLIGKTSNLMPRMQKSNNAESFNEYLQAGTDGIMVDQQGRAVYYSQYIDPTFENFIKTNNITNPEVVRKFNPDTPFPIGAIELKVSWKIVQDGEDTSNIFTMEGVVNKLVNKGGKIVIDPSQTENVTLALVGFHIAGVVQGHPEMIWATFEHEDNAPVVPAKPKPDTVVSTKDWTFYKANTTYQNCNVNLANTNKLILDEKTQILTPSTQVCRQFEFGNNPNNSKTQQNDKNIDSLNTDVLKKLDQNDVWRHYFEVGAIWFLEENSLKPNLPLDTDNNLTGSLKLSNATIETYTQVQSTMNNCFRCHNTMHAFPSTTDLYPLPALNLNISHAFQNIYFWSQESKGAKP